MHRNTSRSEIRTLTRKRERSTSFLCSSIIKVIVCQIIDPDYYEFEAHIFMDDAFDVNEYGEPVINKFVKQFVDVVDQAARYTEKTHNKITSTLTRLLICLFAVVCIRPK